MQLCVAHREDEALWCELLGRIIPKIRGFIRATFHRVHFRPGDRSVAACRQDLIQGVIVRLLSKECAILKRFSGNTEDELSAYLAVICRSVVLDALRRETCYKRHLRVVRDGVRRPPAPSAENLLMIREGIELAERALEEEPGRCAIRDKLILRLHFLHGLSAAQISRIPAFGLSKDGVQKVLDRAKKRGRLMAVARPGAGAGGRFR